MIATTLASLPLLLSVVPVDAGDTPPAHHQPDLLFDVTDEDMATPLGIVSDVGVSDSIVYFLDSTNCNVRRIALSGEFRPSLGRPGTGPGDLNWPLRLAVFSGGRCVVIQQFSKHAPCFTVDGEACPPIDISAFRTGYAATVFLRAAAGPDQQLIISATTNQRAATTPDASFEALGTSALVMRFRAGGDRPEDLFTTRDNGADSNVVFIRGDRYAYVIHGWDINAVGEILYADPAGEYRVSIGHPADGAVSTFDLPALARDDQKIRELAVLIGGKVRAADLPRISSLHWLDNEFFMVTPAAEVKPPVDDEVGTVEVFRRDGSSYGRFSIHCDYDPGNDEVFFRNDVLIVVRGGKSVARATFGELLPPNKDAAPTAEVYEVRVRAYRLFASLRAIR